MRWDSPARWRTACSSSTKASSWSKAQATCCANPRTNGRARSSPASCESTIRGCALGVRRHSHCLDHDQTGRHQADADRATRRWIHRKELTIDVVESREVVHVGQETCRLENEIKVGACGLQDGTDVQQRLARLLTHIAV